MTFEEARAQFPVLEHTAYLNAGTFGPLSRSTAAAVAEWLARDLEHGRSGGAYFEEVLALREVVRARLGALVGVGPEHVALTASTTDGCNIVIAGLGLGPGDEVVTTSEEHFGLLGPLHASGARIVVAEPAPEAILAAVTPRTRLLALSQVLWTTGRELPLAELKARTGLPVLADGAQSVGAIPVDGSALDFLTVSGQKWLCGPDSTGALVVADPERLRVARPSYFSKMDYEPDGRYTAKPGAARFDANWIPAASLAGLLAALDGAPDGRYARAAATAGRLRLLLAGKAEVVAGSHTLVSFHPDGDAGETVARLHEAGVVVRDIPKIGLVRASCGWWTSDGDLERLCEAL
ncbi:MAG: aminotransferase class V-fold PLP-dependent enzyme [Actinobacteria bacterium]|nr:aminotransferase class V-fold PLP-dependent enzyme [Actinomycetota bacterium]